jgi:enterochelin esterase-like enzyme
MIQNIADHMIQNGELDPTIIVTPTWNKSSADTFWSEFREKLVPYIETKYSTYAESGSPDDLVASRYHRAYGGFSMGSISTWGVLMHCLDICAYYMPLSGEYKVNNLSYAQQAQMVGQAIDDSGLGQHEYFIMAATGTNDMAQPQMTPMINELRKLPQLIEGSNLSECNFNYMLVQGKEHWWGHVRHYIYDMLPYFFHEGY